MTSKTRTRSGRKRRVRAVSQGGPGVGIAPPLPALDPLSGGDRMSKPSDAGINGPWRVLIYDGHDPEDPRWVIATVAITTDVRPAKTPLSPVMPAAPVRGVRFPDWPEVRAWVRTQVGFTPNLHVIPASVWQIDQAYEPTQEGQ